MTRINQRIADLPTHVLEEPLAGAGLEDLLPNKENHLPLEATQLPDLDALRLINVSQCSGMGPANDKLRLEIPEQLELHIKNTIINFDCLRVLKDIVKIKSSKISLNINAVLKENSSNQGSKIKHRLAEYLENEAIMFAEIEQVLSMMQQMQAELKHSQEK